MLTYYYLALGVIFFVPFFEGGHGQFAYELA